MVSTRARRKRRGHGWTHYKHHHPTPRLPRYLCNRRATRQYLTVFWNYRSLWVNATIVEEWSTRSRALDTNMLLIDQWVDLRRPLASFVDWVEEQGFDIDRLDQVDI